MKIASASLLESATRREDDEAGQKSVYPNLIFVLNPSTKSTCEFYVVNVLMARYYARSF